MASPVIDVHTHCLTEAWFQLLQQHGGPRYTVKAVTGGLRAIHLDGAPFMTPVPPMFDYGLRLKTMDECGVDVCVVSLTCPNCFWGGPDVSLQAARIMNDDMAAAQTAHPDRLRWFASLPWQYPELALAGLERAHAGGRGGRHGARQHRRRAAHRPGVRADLGGDRREGAAGARASDRAARRRARWTWRASS